MANSVVFDPPPSTYNHDDLFPGYADPLDIPPLDDAMLNGDLSFPDNFLDSDIDPDFNIEDLNFNLDDFLSDPGPGANSDSTDHHSSPSQLPCINSDQNSSYWFPEAEDLNPSFAVQGLNVDQASYGARGSDTENSLNDRDSSGHASSHDSHTGGLQILDSLSPKSGSCDQIGSHGSGVSPVENLPSPESCEGARAMSNYLGDSALKYENLSIDGVAESTKKVKEVGKSNSKRKKDQRDEGSAETRSSKLSKSTATFEDANMCMNVSGGNEGDDKKKARLMRNRESAHLSRQRKKQYVEELEDKVRSMHSTIAELNNRVSYIMAENATLKQQMSGSGVCPPLPPPGMYPMPPMAYPWIYPPYTVKQGSQVPLVPIPRLNPQRPASAPKVSKNLEKSEKKKSQGKTKKLASISFLGLLFFMLLFGGLVPIVNVKYGGFGGKDSLVDRFNDVHRGRTLMVDDGGKCYSDGRCGNEHGRHQDKHIGRIPFEEEKMLQFGANTNGSGIIGNSSDPLAASLYVPRNDKLVRIDGNLIIHSVLASDKAAVASRPAGQMKTSEETRLAIARYYVPTYHVAGAVRSSGVSSENERDYTGSGRQKALGSSSADNLKTSASDGRLKQWFLDDLAGPVLNSGMCTEVFQFDVSPSPGSIVPATSMTNVGKEYRQNSTRHNTSSRRILRGPAIPLKGNAYNLTNKHAELDAEKVGLQANKSSSSIVVSVLVDPREVNDVESEGMMRSKSLSRIFVVVLIDSVKYVTYSCMLPLMGSSSHMGAQQLQRRYESIDDPENPSERVPASSQYNAFIAASLHIKDMSAPVKPSVKRDSTILSTSGLHGILRK
ncbi:hypothetical protein V2J09_016021 [Rumex salicifolius]